MIDKNKSPKDESKIKIAAQMTNATWNSSTPDAKVAGKACSYVARCTTFLFATWY
jgi:hypothetical protein